MVADERDTLLALLLAGLRGASVRALAREEALGSAGAARRPLEVRLVGVAAWGRERGGGAACGARLPKRGGIIALHGPVAGRGAGRP